MHIRQLVVSALALSGASATAIVRDRAAGGEGLLQRLGAGRNEAVLPGLELGKEAAARPAATGTSAAEPTGAVALPAPPAVNETGAYSGENAAEAKKKPAKKPAKVKEHVAVCLPPAKEAAKEAAKAEKDAAKEADKAENDAAKAADKAEKDAAKAEDANNEENADIEEDNVVLEYPKAADKAEKEAAKAEDANDEENADIEEDNVVLEYPKAAGGAAAEYAAANRVGQNLRLGGVDLGIVQCNAARARIVGALRDTDQSVGEIQEPAIQQAATAGLQMANGGIVTIGHAIIAGQAPPQEARDMVEAGLAQAGDALAAGDANDQAVVKAQESLHDAVKAGDDVVANC